MQHFLQRFTLATCTCIVFNLVSFSVPSQATPPVHYTELEFPPLPEIQLPEYERFELSNGLVVYLVEDHELPLVDGTAIFRVGGRWEPADKVGLASLTGALMRNGGTQTHEFEEINQFLEQRAASIETSIGTTAGSAGFSVLSEDLDSVLSLFAEIIQEPEFPQARLDLLKFLARGNIERRNDDPSDITNREFSKLIYGASSPYARTVEYENLKNIRRQDVVEFYDRFIHPNSTILGIVGDFDPEQVRLKIEQTFGNWQPDFTPLPALPPVAADASGQVFVVEQPQMTQSYVLMGHLGGMRDNPDYPILTVLNEVLNGHGGRLFNEIRSRQGLAYSVYSYWLANYDFPGTFLAGGQTRSETTIPFIQVLREELEVLQNRPITEQELQNAKEVVLNSFIFNFQTPDQTLARLMRYEYYGYPEDFIFRYRQGVEATTIEDIYRVSQTYLQLDQLTTLVVGNLQGLANALARLSPTGQVEIVDITIPQSKS